MKLHSVREGWRIAFDQLRANKLRSALTVLGVVIGIATVMAMASIVAGFREQIVNTLEVVGPTTFRVLRFFSSTPLNPDALPREVRIRPALTPQEAEAIARLPEIHYAAIWTQLFYRFEYAGNRTQILGVFGADDRYMEILGGGLVTGRVFTTAELRSGAPVTVIEQRTVDRLFGARDPIGEIVRIGGRPFRVLGVWQRPTNIFEVPGAPEIAGIVPFEAARERFQIDQVLGIFDSLTFAFFFVMLVLSSIALLVGGIGVMAIMMVSVTSRTREIGLRKAMGATRRDVLWQFLVEAATLTLMGGILGIILGIGTGELLKRLLDFNTTVPVWSAALARFIPHSAFRIPHSDSRRDLPTRRPPGNRRPPRRCGTDLRRHARQGRAGGPSRRDHRLDPRRDRHARRRHHTRRRGRARNPGARRARAAQRRAPRRPPPERRAVAREAHRADPRHAAPGGDSPVPRRAPSRPPHRVGAGTRRVLPGRARQVWEGRGGRGGRGGRRAPAVQSPLRPRVPRGSGEAVVRRGHLRYLRHQDGGHPLLRIAVRRCQGGGGDPSHGTGSLRADPNSVGALWFPDSLGLRRAVLLPRDPRGRRRAAAWRAVPLASRFPRMPKRLVYLDNAATTPVRPEVLEAMLPYLGPDAFGNPSSPHRFGRAARAGVEEAKRKIAAALGADPGQVIFTSGGTEADNLAVIGCALV